MTNPNCKGCGEPFQIGSSTGVVREIGNVCAACRPSPRPVYKSGTHLTCNICKGPLGADLFDANIFRFGWANICRGCFDHCSCKLGTGLGQHYAKQPDGRWLKIGG